MSLLGAGGFHFHFRDRQVGGGTLERVRGTGGYWGEGQNSPTVYLGMCCGEDWVYRGYVLSE